jgi:hypothetical protein
VNDQLEPLSYRDEKAKQIIDRFCDRVHWLISIRHTFKVLFEDDQPSCKPLIEKTAPLFFSDLNRILHEYLLLECAKITDNAITLGNENFTVDYLVRNICWPCDTKKELESLRAVTQNFRRFIETARNKRLAHSDLDAYCSEKVLGEFGEGEDRKFFDALERIGNLSHEACFGTICGEMSPIAAGDVIDLRSALKCAVAFKEALSESSGRNLTWLYSCLQKAEHEKASK